MAATQVAALAQDTSEKSKRQRKGRREQGQDKGRLPILRYGIIGLFSTLVLLFGHGHQESHQMASRIGYGRSPGRDQTDSGRWRNARIERRAAKLKQEEKPCCQVGQTEESKSNEAVAMGTVSREYGRGTTVLHQQNLLLSWWLTAPRMSWRSWKPSRFGTCSHRKFRLGRTLLERGGLLPSKPIRRRYVEP